MSKVPKLRFPEFKGEWEEKELGEVSDIIAGQSPSGESYNESGKGIPFYQGKTEFGYKFLMPPKKWTIAPIKLAEKGDILMSVRAPVGALNVSIQKICIGRGLATIKPINNDKWFLYYFLTTIEDKIVGNGGSIFDSITKNQIEKIKLILPSIEEQQKIADCLSSLDELIEACREKIASLKAYKKGLLQQLFPQEMYNNYPPPLISNKLPKLRFAGFEGEWEEVRLGEIGCFYRGITYGSESVSKEGLLVLRSSNIQDDTLIIDKDLVFIDKEAPTELLLQKGDIVICMSNGSKELVGKNAEYKGNYYNNITVGAFCSFFRPKIAIAKYVFQTEQYSNYISLSMGGGNINNLKNSTLEKYTCYIPKDLAEQEKIANCLSSLDELIEAKNKKIELLESYKKGLLQQMFVN